MEKYLSNFHKIKQNIVDVSDYENFYTGAQDYIRNSTAITHEVVDSLCSAIRSFKSPYLISLAYEILGCIDSAFVTTEEGCAVGTISKRLIKQHFKNKYIRGSMLSCIVVHGIVCLHRHVIKKLIPSPTYITLVLFDFINASPECVEAFMKSNDLGCINKQLAIIENCIVPFDIDTYMAHLGSSSKLRALKAYEAFICYFIRQKRESTAIFTSEPECSIKFDLDLLYKPTQCLSVDSARNFIIFGYNFLVDRDIIEECIVKEDRAYLLDVINKYFACPMFEAPYISIDELCPARWFNKEKTYTAQSSDFDHLFSSPNYKMLTDCIEI